MKRFIFGVLLTVAFAKPLLAQCDAECAFIRKVVADVPNLFRNVRDCDGKMLVLPPDGGACIYRYNSETGSAELFCMTTPRTSLAVAMQRYKSDVAMLPSMLGSGWSIGSEESGPLMHSVVAKQNATGATIQISTAELKDVAWASIKVVTPKK